jgi:hypothetical protein
LSISPKFILTGAPHFPDYKPSYYFKLKLAHQFSNVDPSFSHSGRLLDDEGAVSEVRQPTLGRGWDLFVRPNILKMIQKLDSESILGNGRDFFIILFNSWEGRGALHWASHPLLFDCMSILGNGRELL